MFNTIYALPFISFGCFTAATYVLTDDYSSDNFFQDFNAFTGNDPTSGYVRYLDFPSAASHRYIGTVRNRGNASYLGVDFLSSGTNRSAVRIESKKRFNHGLFIADIQHMPGGICGVWPAFWLVGPDWPVNGEIDIIEGVNDQLTNQMTLHTGSNCSIDRSGFTGMVGTMNCDTNAMNQTKNAGCSISSRDPASYGAEFNQIGGGIFATEWTADKIDVYFFPRNQVPPDVQSQNPDPSSWGFPVARFAGACDIDSHFKDMQMVIDTTFCGDWAGRVWDQSSCSRLARDCQSFVGDHHAPFKEAYWLINSVRVYQLNS